MSKNSNLVLQSLNIYRFIQKVLLYIYISKRHIGTRLNRFFDYVLKMQRVGHCRDRFVVWSSISGKETFRLSSKWQFVNNHQSTCLIFSFRNISNTLFRLFSRQMNTVTQLRIAGNKCKQRGKSFKFCYSNLAWKNSRVLDDRLWH